MEWNILFIYSYTYRKKERVKWIHTRHIMILLTCKLSTKTMIRIKVTKRKTKNNSEKERRKLKRNEAFQMCFYRCYKYHFISFHWIVYHINEIIWTNRVLEQGSTRIGRSRNHTPWEYLCQYYKVLYTINQLQFKGGRMLWK